MFVYSKQSFGFIALIVALSVLMDVVLFVLVVVMSVIHCLCRASAKWAVTVTRKAKALVSQSTTITLQAAAQQLFLLASMWHPPILLCKHLKWLLQWQTQVLHQLVMFRTVFFFLDRWHFLVSSWQICKTHPICLASNSRMLDTVCVRGRFDVQSKRYAKLIGDSKLPRAVIANA